MAQQRQRRKTASRNGRKATSALPPGPNEPTKVIELPNGDTWEVITRPTWGRIKGLTAGMDPSDLLVLLTVDWSFDEPITVDAIDNIRDILDTIKVMGVINEYVLPLLEELGKTSPTMKKLLEN